LTNEVNMKRTDTIFLFSLFRERALSNFILAGAFLFIVLLILFLPTPFEHSAHAQSSNSNVAIAIATPSPEPTPPKATVRGKAVYDDTGRPIRRASVILASQNNTYRIGVTSVTDMDGNFEFKDVVAGTYIFIVNSPGLITPYGYANDVNIDIPSKVNDKLFEVFREEFTVVTVEGTKDVKVDVRAKRGGAISGRVTYADGDPAVNITINILRKNKEKTSRVITGLSIESIIGIKTDDRGMYRVAGLPPGDYFVVANEPVTHTDKSASSDSEFETIFGAGGSMLLTFYPGASTKEEATPITLTAGQEQTETNISLPERGLYKIRGTVIARSDKRPLKGFNVTLKRKDKLSSLNALGPSSERLNTDTTGEDGSWSFKDLPEGAYTIKVESSYEYEEQATKTDSGKEPKRKKRLSGKTQEIKILSGDVTDVLIELSDGGRITGTVVMGNGKPVTNFLPATIKAKPLVDDAEDEEDSYPYYREKYTGYVDDKGNFSIEGLPSGPVNFDVSVREEVYVKSIMANGIDVTNSPLNLMEGADVQNVQIVLGDDMATLKGVLRSAGDKPANMAVMLIPTNQAKWKARSSIDSYKGDVPKQNGEFSIKAAPGEYFIVFVPMTTSSVITSTWLKERTANAQRITLAANATQTVTLTAPQ